MTRTLTRRGFVSMLASVPLVAVAAPKIFLPSHSRFPRTLDELHWMIREDIEHALYGEMSKGPIPWTDAGLSRMTEATRSVLSEWVPTGTGLLFSIPSLNIINVPIQGFEAGDSFEWP